LEAIRIQRLERELEEVKVQSAADKLTQEQLYHDLERAHIASRKTNDELTERNAKLHGDLKQKGSLHA
jgi:hypothetical protein